MICFNIKIYAKLMNMVMVSIHAIHRVFMYYRLFRVFVFCC
jgi:hypothetical protein